MSNYQTVNLPRELAESIAKVCMFTMLAEDSKQLRAILARPSAPVERDERAAFERAIVAEWPQAPLIRKRDLLPKDDPCYDDYCDEPLQRAWVGWRMRAWLEGSKPTVLSKCVLCDQLQADLTALDEKLDQTHDLLRYMVYDYRSVVQAGYDKITGLGSDCDSVAKMLADNPNYQKALALLMPDLESRPEERGTPEAEPCSGCGTPGYTGNCDKCVPY